VDELLGQGAWGEVRAAVHLPTGQPAAIKLLPCRSDLERARVHQEVRAMARLQHPHVVSIFDLGEVEGRAWFAMERAEASLQERPPRTGEALHEVLRAVLSALAAAHARGVVHRDLKPANLLWTAIGHVKLADFGVARLAGAAAVARAGTEGFMAPELLRGDLGEQGPGTDLYAVGRLVTHLWAAPDPAWAEWVAWLTAPAPQDRPRSAAEALAALPAAPGGLLDPASPASPILSSDPSPPGGTAATVAAGGLGEPGPRSLSPTGGTRRPWAPVLPVDWRQPAEAVPPLAGSGLALLELREAAPVGRAEVQDRLWQALRRASEAPVGLMLVGADGSGVGGLARWLGLRAAEAGVRTWVAGAGSPGQGGSGAGSTVAELLQAGLAPEARAPSGRVASAAIRRALLQRGASAGLVRQVLALLRGRPSQTPVAKLLHDVLALDPAPRLVVISDPAASPDLAQALRAVMDVGLPLLVVATGARSSPLLPLPALPLPALAPGALRALLSGLLPLEPAFAASLEARSGGQPGLAILLLRHQVRTGALVQGPRGWHHRDGLRWEALDGPLAVWRHEVEGWPRARRQVATLAAWLGLRFSHDRLRAACALSGLDPAELLPLVRSGVLAWTSTGGRFTAPALVAALCAGPEAAALAGQVAQVLPPGADAHRGRLLLAAGRVAEAATELCGAIEALGVQTRDHHALLELVGLAEEVVPLGDPRRDELEGARLLALVHLREWLPEAVALAEQIMARPGGDAVLRRRALMARCRVAVIQGRYAEALELARAARGTGPQDLGLVGHLVTALYGLGRLAEVEASCVEALAEYGRLSAELWRMRGEAALMRGELALAQRCAGRAVRGASGVQRIYAIQLQGAIHQVQGDLAAAEAGYRRAAEAGTGLVDGLMPWTNLSLVAALRGEAERARQEAENLVPRLRAVGWRQNLAYVLAVLWGTVEEPVQAERFGAEARALCQALALRDPDLAWLARQAADRAEAAGQGELAAAARRWAETA